MSTLAQRFYTANDNRLSKLHKDGELFRSYRDKARRRQWSPKEEPAAAHSYSSPTSLLNPQVLSINPQPGDVCFTRFGDAGNAKNLLGGSGRVGLSGGGAISLLKDLGVSYVCLRQPERV
ncbi:predicted protein [Coccidioides posadasii str. Silveira]|uniref:Predicted protein n=1 Tax=Coccidioides posadasii (strain RMSCC 757 / Silveira) TaxID=443226 RepID=E9DJZ7_COCPS|nr:predicted protein [Coccidioides posadasii str. Silveira]